ncbi:hypothetical protein J8F10_06570 [Gemmata sp. G18]|uniref:Uncharacterized protein n=1 Tax=Gemmata palustris TaxID=2822762 RepID=A0ABS5BMI8_9BACT|nr:DUF6173 family protein [Gemmata palustris]MBP3954944.1 hypothetical protein [Gemmata palustris]
MNDEIRRALASGFTPSFNTDMLKNIKPLAQQIAEVNYASKFYKHLGEMIREFDARLDAEHEVGARLVNFGPSLTFHITGLGYQNPSLIIFYGITEDGNPIELIQNVSQINVLLMKLPKLDPSKPKHRFGFKPPGEEE